MLKLGDYNTLRIRKRTEYGLYLDGGEEGNILLPNRYVTKDMRIGDEIEVFIYLDQEERTIATTEHPIAKVGEFAYLECAWTNEYGAFLRWGLMKDLFCPFREQKTRMEIGKTIRRMTVDRGCLISQRSCSVIFMSMTAIAIWVTNHLQKGYTSVSRYPRRITKKPSATSIADGLLLFRKKESSLFNRFFN